MMSQMSAMFTSMKEENKKGRARARQDMAKAAKDSDPHRDGSKAKRSRKSPSSSPTGSGDITPKTPRDTDEVLDDIVEGDSDAEMAEPASSKPPET